MRINLGGKEKPERTERYEPLVVPRPERHDRPVEAEPQKKEKKKDRELIPA